MRGGTKSPGKKRLVDRLLLEGQQSDADFGMGVVQASTQESFPVCIHIDQIPGRRRAQDLGNIRIEHPQVTVVSRLVTLGSEKNSCSRTGHRLSHGHPYIQ